MKYTLNSLYATISYHLLLTENYITPNLENRSIVSILNIIVIIFYNIFYLELNKIY